LVKLKDEIKYLLKEDLSKGFPTDVYNLMEQAELIYNVKNNRYVITNYQVVWFAVYNFKRAVQQNANETVKEFLKCWVEKIFTGNIEEVKNTKYHALQYIAIAARWASMELR